MDIEQLREDEASFRKGEVSLKTYKLGQIAHTPEEHKDTLEKLREEHVLRLEAKVAQLTQRNKELYFEVLQYEKVCKLLTAEFHKQINHHGIAAVIFALMCLGIGYGLARF